MLQRDTLRPVGHKYQITLSPARAHTNAIVRIEHETPIHLEHIILISGVDHDHRYCRQEINNVKTENRMRHTV
jgi:hypothetical protein